MALITYLITLFDFLLELISNMFKHEILLKK